MYAGMIASAVFLVALSFLNCTQTALAVTMLTLGTAMSGLSLCGFFVNHIDIAPQYAGTLMGVSNGIGAVSGFITPAVAAALTTDVSRDFTIGSLRSEYLLLLSVVKVARSSRGAHGTEASMGVGNLTHFMHKISLFH